MNVLAHWIPTFVGTIILIVAAFLLDLSIRRDERKKRQTGPGSDASPKLR